MRSRIKWLLVLAIGLAAAGAGMIWRTLRGDTATLTVEAGSGPSPILPSPVPAAVPHVNIAKAVGWPTGTKPVAALGLKVVPFAAGLNHPRSLYLLPNGDVLVAETNRPAGGNAPRGLFARITGLVLRRAGAAVPSPNRIILLRDRDRDGRAELRTVFLDKLHSPFGMALIGTNFYVANVDALWRFPYRPEATAIAEPGRRIAAFPGGPSGHWTRNLIAGPDGSRLYVSIGSSSNIGEIGLEQEEGRASIWEIDPANGRMRPFATGLRNPVGLALEPLSGQLWTSVNERDSLGSDLVPDYVTAVKEGGFYGWPYSYFGRNIDSRVVPQRRDLVARAIVPDYALGPHTASLGIAFSQQAHSLPPNWRSGLFVAQHGSWNRRPKSGYKVVYVPFANGRPAGMPRDVLTGFLNGREQAQGRPAGVMVDQAGGLLVADDVGNIVWRVTGALSPPPDPTSELSR